MKSVLRLLLIINVVLSASLFADVNNLSEEVRSNEYSLSKKGLALKGYDPVAYFQNGPSKGKRKFTYTYKEVTYWFVDEVNRAEFMETPSKYEPQYGGWCAWAMADEGGRTKANPESYKIVDGKLYVFYDGLLGDTLKQWNDVGNDEKLIGLADQYWADQVLK